jgi:hypothetical protein
MPPLPKDDELLDEQALPTIASAATIESIERLGVMDASLLAQA